MPEPETLQRVLVRGRYPGAARPEGMGYRYVLLDDGCACAFPEADVTDDDDTLPF